MHTKYSSIHNGPQSKIIEYFAAPSPYIATSVFSLTFVVKPIYLRYLSRFMISSDESHSLRVSDFESEKEEECFDTIESSIDKVTCWDG